MTTQSSSTFRRRLAAVIASAVGATTLALGCSSGTGTSGTGGGSTDAGNPCAPASGGNKTTSCFQWPSPTTSTSTSTSASSASGSGGMGGSGGTGGTGGIGGMGGTGGKGPVPACPAPQDAGFRFGACGVASVDGPGTYQNGQCCYPVTTGCCSGRPFVVDEHWLTASLVRGDGGWRGDLAPHVESLDSATRSALADAWSRDALLEHASIASFSRFSLELMAVGAPSELVDAAHAAARDEVDHARACFALASAYAGSALGPSAFELGGRVEVSADLAVVAAKAVTEGCIGETLAAMQAAEGAAQATDPVVRDMLEGIARDESRHAALAYRFVAWAIATGGERVRDAVDRAFAGAFDRAPVLADDVCDLSRHGRARAADLRSSFRETLSEVIAPAARALGAAQLS